MHVELDYATAQVILGMLKNNTELQIKLFNNQMYLNVFNGYPKCNAYIVLTDLSTQLDKPFYYTTVQIDIIQSVLAPMKKLEIYYLDIDIFTNELRFSVKDYVTDTVQHLGTAKIHLINATQFGIYEVPLAKELYEMVAINQVKPFKQALYNLVSTLNVTKSQYWAEDYLFIKNMKDAPAIILQSYNSQQYFAQIISDLHIERDILVKLRDLEYLKPLMFSTLDFLYMFIYNDRLFFTYKNAALSIPIYKPEGREIEIERVAQHFRSKDCYDVYKFNLKEIETVVKTLKNKKAKYNITFEHMTTEKDDKWYIKCYQVVNKEEILVCQKYLTQGVTLSNIHNLPEFTISLFDLKRLLKIIKDPNPTFWVTKDGVLTRILTQDNKLLIYQAGIVDIKKKLQKENEATAVNA